MSGSSIGRGGNSKALSGFEPGVMWKSTTSPDVALMFGLLQLLRPLKASMSRDSSSVGGEVAQATKDNIKWDSILLRITFQVTLLGFLCFVERRVRKN